MIGAAGGFWTGAGVTGIEAFGKEAPQNSQKLAPAGFGAPQDPQFIAGLSFVFISIKEPQLVQCVAFGGFSNPQVLHILPITILLIIYESAELKLGENLIQETHSGGRDGK